MKSWKKKPARTQDKQKSEKIRKQNFMIAFFKKCPQLYKINFPKQNCKKMEAIKHLICRNTQNAKESIDDIEQTKRILSKNLYQISPLNKSINRDILSLAYSPGVGEVCLELKQHPQKVDALTFRARAVAVVSDGSMLGSEGKKFMPVMDWIIIQLKYYAGVDAFPFVVRKQTNLDELFEDLSTSYGTILYLDDKKFAKLPKDTLFVNQQDITNLFGLELTEASKTAVILAYLIENKIKGFATLDDYHAGKNYKTNNFTETKEFENMLHDQRTLKEHAIQFHQFYQGKICIELNFRDINKIKPYFSEKALRKLVQQQYPPSKTSKVCAIVTDGTAILGLGNIGPVAGLPVMEGKSLLFKVLGDVDVVPFCIFPKKNTKDQIAHIYNAAGYFRAINLQDIKAPQCFDVEKGLKQLKSLPIFHDDQHGTAIVTLAGLINSMKLAEKDFKKAKIVINGAGAAGDTIARLILKHGVQGKNLIVCDTKGAIYAGRKQGMNSAKQELASISNLDGVKGSLEDAIKGADVFIGVSVENALKKEWLKKMNNKPIIFALANPIPQILPKEAAEGGAFIYASGRSDFSNQINNSLVFPGIFKGIIRHDLAEITEDMKLWAAEAIADSLTKKASTQYIIPDSLDRDVTLRIMQELGKAKKEGKHEAKSRL